jgi:gliding motility-associated-like protein
MKMKPQVRTLLVFIFLVLCSRAFAQKEGNIWYFGNYAGLDFNTGAPFALTDGALKTLDGCATISNANGKLLFYTDGITVWDKTHTIMPNGKALAGGLSSTQSAIIIPKPLNTNLYYIFTVDYQMGPQGLEYSIVDMSKNFGNGDVVTKNVKLKSKACEKLTAVQHSNKKDIWVIVHDSARNYLSYLVTDSGVRAKPVVSGGGIDVGSSNFNAIGYLKVSSGGNKFAGAIKYLNVIEIGDFDNSTGKLSNMQTIPNVNTAYGLEFSPDNTKLYATNYFDQQLYQFDFGTSDINAIIKSRDTIFTSQSALSAIQQAPDGKIYVSRDAHDKLGVIANPNKKGKACKYTDEGFYLGGRRCYSGLPTFVQSFFIPVTDFIFANTCLGDGTRFIGKTNINPDKWYWDFDDPVSTNHNTDNSQNPVHYFSSARTYHVKMVVSLNGATDTIAQDVTITDVPTVNLGPDQVTCLGQPVGLDAGSPGFKYRWSTGDTTQKIKADSTAKYWLAISKGTCSRSDTLNLTFIKIGADYKLGGNKVVCGKASYTLSKNIKGAHILWSTGETDTTITVTKTGNYWIRITLGPCTVYDTIIVFFEAPPVVNIGKDTVLCEGNADTLNASVKGASYLWSTGETTPKITVKAGGNYWVKVSASGCVVYDTVHIRHCRAKVFMPDVFTPNGDSLNDVFRPYGTDMERALLTVTNRWGEIVYQYDAKKKGWDGYFKGELCPAGLYGYVLIYREYEGDILYDRQISGKVYLAR